MTIINKWLRSENNRGHALKKNKADFGENPGTPPDQTHRNAFKILFNIPKSSKISICQIFPAVIPFDGMMLP